MLIKGTCQKELLALLLVTSLEMLSGRDTLPDLDLGGAQTTFILRGPSERGY